MAGNKKPARKAKPAVRPRVGATPMMRETYEQILRELHGSVCTLIAAPSVLAWNEVMKLLESVTIATAFQRRKSLNGDRDELANGLRTLLYALQASGDRHDRTGVMAVTDSEAQSIRLAAKIIDEALPKIPHNVYLASQLEAKRQQAFTHEMKMAQQMAMAA